MILHPGLKRPLCPETDSGNIWQSGAPMEFSYEASRGQISKIPPNGFTRSCQLASQKINSDTLSFADQIDNGITSVRGAHDSNKGSCSDGKLPNLMTVVFSMRNRLSLTCTCNSEYLERY